MLVPVASPIRDGHSEADRESYVKAIGDEMAEMRIFTEPVDRLYDAGVAAPARGFYRLKAHAEGSRSMKWWRQ